MYHQWYVDDPKAITLTTASATSVNVPSINSHLSGQSRRRLPSPITNGATMMMPRASEASQLSQMVKTGASDLWNKMKPTVATAPDSAGPMTAAA